jgi:hypothetical protein
MQNRDDPVHAQTRYRAKWYKGISFTAWLAIQVKMSLNLRVMYFFQSTDFLFGNTDALYLNLNTLNYIFQ